MLSGPIQQNGLDPTKSEIQKLQNHIQQLEYNVKAMATVSLTMTNVNVPTLIAFLRNVLTFAESPQLSVF